ncbi:MAG: hypothetical protein R3240_04315, partial [Gammaproteobacteria bacterium]|nr:hypothetical protein [Gammaproteobacteria bacterium]
VAKENGGRAYATGLYFPSEAEKNQLMTIKNSSDSESVKILAGAMYNLHHSAQGMDKPLLRKVMNDSTASTDEKNLASIILNLSHKPTSDDKKQLATMINFAEN